MFRAFFQKEWVKTRGVWWLLFAAHLCFAAWLVLRLRNVFVHYDAKQVWSAWVFDSYLFAGPYQYAPLLTGILLGCCQFLPEVLGKRIRLVLHLPLGEERAVALHLLVGVLLISAAELPALLLFGLAAVHYFPVEFHGSLWSVITPWLFAGFAGYFLTAAVLLEMAWRYRIVFLLLAAGVLRLFFLGDAYGVYLPLLPWIAFWTALSLFLPLLASYRFRKGLNS